jgi:hypothetical protein
LLSKCSTFTYERGGMTISLRYTHIFVYIIEKNGKIWH